MELKDNHSNESVPDGTLLLRYIRKQVTATERQYVEEWLKADSSHETELLKLAHIYFAQEKQRRIRERDVYKAFDKVQRLLFRRSRQLHISRLAAAAACITGLILLSSALFLLSKLNLHETLTQKVSMTSKGGVPIPFFLPDSTVVYLSNGSTLAYPSTFDGKERKVRLRGEAYFQVKHNEQQPFIVSVYDDKINIKVLGTTFNVQAYQEDAQVATTLLSGRVNLIVNRPDGWKEEQSLYPSEKAVYHLSSGRMQVNRVNTSDDIAWIEGKLVFNDLPLRQVLEKLTRFYHVEFEVKDDVIYTYKFRGTFKNKSLVHILEYVKISSEVEYSVIEEASGMYAEPAKTKVILRKKKK